jgi:hypothetical protein
MQHKYTINKFVLNFNNKVIGVMAEEPPPYERNGFIPCYPSAINEEFKKDVNVVFMTDLSLWTTYKNTVQFLNKLNKRSKLRKLEADMPYLPAFKIVEEDHVVGILTNTNQFIQLSQPIRLDDVPHALDIPTMSNNNYIVDISKKPMVQSEVEFTTQTDVYKERVDYIKRIRLETSFYNVFRNTIRILINDYEKLLIELGEKSWFQEKSNIPVELRLVGTVFINAGLFIIMTKALLSNIYIKQLKKNS